MFDDILLEQNLHWAGSSYEDGIARTCFPTLLKYLTLPHVISIVGIRRSGKSTLVKQLMNALLKKVKPENILFLNLEHPYFAQYAQDVRFLEEILQDYLKLYDPKGKIYCFLDEVQFFKDWPIFVKAHYERKNIKFIVTGSNSKLISSDLLTLLSGRTLPMEVFPLSFKEIIQDGGIKLDRTSLVKHKPKLRKSQEEYLIYGGFPEVYLLKDKELAFDVLNAYAKTILYQDVAPRLQLKKPSDLEKLFFYLISNISSAFSYNKLSALFELSDKTIKEYITGFEEAFLLFQVECFAFSVKKQMRSYKKIYARDVGLVNAIAFKFSENLGRLLENTVFLELKRRGKKVYYYKTEQGQEVDFVAQEGKDLALIQAAVSLRSFDTREREIHALIRGAQELKLKQGLIVTLDEEEKFQEQGIMISVVPLYKFLMNLSN